MQIRERRQNCPCTRGRIENQTSPRTHKTHLLMEQEERNKLMKLLFLSKCTELSHSSDSKHVCTHKKIWLISMHILFNWTRHGKAKNELIFSAVCIICQVLNPLQTIASFAGITLSFISYTLFMPSSAHILSRPLGGKIQMVLLGLQFVSVGWNVSKFNQLGNLNNKPANIMYLLFSIGLVHY